VRKSLTRRPLIHIYFSDYSLGPKVTNIYGTHLRGRNGIDASVEAGIRVERVPTQPVWDRTFGSGHMRITSRNQVGGPQCQGKECRCEPSKGKSNQKSLHKYFGDYRES
jgi:hypothetical protein